VSTGANTHTHTNLAECVRKELLQVAAICDICLQSAHPVTLHYITFSHHSVSEHHVIPFQPIRNIFKHRFPSHSAVADSAQPYVFRHIPRNVRGRTYYSKPSVLAQTTDPISRISPL